MTLVDGSIGFSPAFMWCGVADIPGMPSSTARDEWGAVIFFGAVLKAAEIISAQPGSAQCGFAQPRLTIRCAHRSVRHHIRRWPQNALRKCDSSAGFCLAEPMGLRSGGSEARQGTLTITGSNVRLGTEMPVALSSFSL